MKKYTSKMHKATHCIDIICCKLRGKAMIHTQLCGPQSDIAKHVAGNGYLIYFCFAFKKQTVFL